LPFEVPEGWAWVKGTNCFNPLASKKPTGKTFGYYEKNYVINLFCPCFAGVFKQRNTGRAYLHANGWFPVCLLL
jgi:hypothetical protein